MSRAVPPSRRTFQPRLETLEDRFVPARLHLFGPPVPPPAAPAWANDHILVRFAENFMPQALGGTQIGAQLPLVDGLYRVDLLDRRNVRKTVQAYERLPGVLYAQPDYFVQPAARPNDTSYDVQWHLNNTGQNGGKVDVDLDAPEAWDITHGNGSAIVAVIDTGVDWTHPDLAANIWVNAGEIAGNGIDDDGNGYVDDVRGWDFANNDNNPMDDFGHGTHVAGILGAVGNNARGVSGVMWQVQIMPLKFIGANGGGAISDAIRALDYAVMMGATVSNNSWSVSTYDQALMDAIARARINDHIYVAAAGNNARNIDQYPAYPANYAVDNVLAVASVNRLGQLASTSNYGTNTVDLAAPGEGIYSTLPGNRYGTMSGTSMATPQVAATVALLREQHPDWNYQQVIDRLLSSVDRRPELATKVASGGRLNLARALREDLTGTAGARVAAIATFNTTSVGKVRVTFLDTLDVVQTASFTRDDVKLFRPDGSVVAISGVSYIFGSNNRQFDITFAAQTMPGTYQLQIGPNILNASGNTMNQDGDAQAGESVEDSFRGTFRVNQVVTFANTTAMALPDLSTKVSSITITQNITIADVNVRINVGHTYDANLVIKLIAPDGTEILLVNRRGGSGDNFSGTLFNDEASFSVTGGAAPFSSSYRPETPLSVLDGKSTLGTWQLRIEDKASGNSGTLNSWSMIVEG